MRMMMNQLKDEVEIGELRVIVVVERLNLKTKFRVIDLRI